MAGVFLVAPLGAAAGGDAAALADLSIEQLAELEVTSVSKRREKLSDAPASIFVITADDIRRSGGTTLPEILRLAPNLQVARRDSVQYAITARGFNNAVGNKLLVLIDGRTVYTPLFSGVFWEMQDTMLEDIERIEVISGPGATLWGANAVNGVINIITRSTSDTRGAVFAADAGSDERGVGLRFGADLGNRGAFRVYGRFRDWDHTELENGNAALDNWSRGQIGFRGDWEGERDTFTLQGDAYRGASQDRGTVGPFVLGEIDISGVNVLGRWSRRFDGGASFRLQGYYDRTQREDAIFFAPEAEIFDVELQNGIPIGRHRILWGGGYRYANDNVGPGVFTVFIPEGRTLDWQNIFLQDEIQLTDEIAATAGIKLEWNDYTGLEYLPNVRLAWKPAEERLFWTSVSRAVRAPSRFDRDVFSPSFPPFIVAGGPDFESEVARVFEIGYRDRLWDVLNVSATVFYHDWDDLRSGTPLPLPIHLTNDIRGESYGGEAWATWQATSFWRLSAGMTVLGKDLEFKPGTSDTVGVNNETLHNDPDYQWQVRSNLDLPHDLELDMFLWQVDKLTVEPVPRYTELNVRLAWRPIDAAELAIVGRNLLHGDHPEFGDPSSRSEVARSVILSFRLDL